MVLEMSTAGSSSNQLDTEPASENKEGGKNDSVARRRRDVRTARDRLGEQFDELRSVLPKKDGSDLTAKSQILERALSVLRSLMERTTTLAVELAVVSPEATHRWLQDVSDDGRRPVEATVSQVMKLFCWSRKWQYAEWWTLDEQRADLAGADADTFFPGRPTSDELVAANSEAARPATGPENMQACVIRDSVSVMRLARTLINTSSSDGDTSSSNDRRVNLEKFADISKKYQFRPRMGMPGRVWSSRRAEWLPGLQDNETYKRSPLADEFGMKSCLAIPVVLGGQVHSVMAFYSTTPRSYNAQCHDLATSLAESIAGIYSPAGGNGWDAAVAGLAFAGTSVLS